MNCPYCQTLCDDADHFCHICGAPLQTEYRSPKPKKGSRWVPLVLLILMSIGGLIGFFATADRTTPIRSEGRTPWFYVQDGVLYFEEHRYTGDGELTVPSKIAGQTVSALGENCFADCTSLTTIYLPNTLTSIGDGAFSGCTLLRGVSLPDSVCVIGKKAFHGCSALEAVHIGQSVRTIGKDAFDDCSYLSYVFYDGTYSSWTALYDEFINPDVAIICQDGSFYQSGKLYK